MKLAYTLSIGIILLALKRNLVTKLVLFHT